ncbi:hypothetical protein VPH35_091606 [Triticum aestivum]
MAPPAVVGFADLPTEALDEIARRVGPLDNVLCSAVCRPWRRALRTTRLRLLGRRPDRPPNYIDTYVYGTRDGPYPVETVVDRDVARSRIIGSSYGWAVTVDDDTWAMFLLDPFTGRRFPLPPFSDSLPGKQRREPKGGSFWKPDGNSRLWRHMFRKAALAPGRRLGTYAVMLLHSNGRGLSYLAPGATSWAALRPRRGMPHKYLDVILHKGAFYTVSCYGEVNAWVPDGDGGLRARPVTNPLHEQVWAVLAVSMSGHDILMVSSTETKESSYKYNHYSFSSTDNYWRRPKSVRRCVESERTWLPVENGNEMRIIVGEGCCLCVPASYGGRYDGYGSSGPHWFLPYVPRLDPAFW